MLASHHRVFPFLSAVCLCLWSCADTQEAGEPAVPVAEPIDAFAGCWFGTWRQNEAATSGSVRLEIELRAERSSGRLDLERDLLPAEEEDEDDEQPAANEAFDRTALAGDRSAERSELSGESEAFGTLSLVLEAMDASQGTGTVAGEGRRDEATLLTLTGSLAGSNLELEYTAYVGDPERESAGRITLVRHACGSSRGPGLEAALNDDIFNDPNNRPLPRDQALAFYLTDALERARALNDDANLEVILMRRPNSQGRVQLELTDDPVDASSLRFSFANSQDRDLFTVDYFARAVASSFPRTTPQNGAVIYEFLRDEDVASIPTEAEIVAAMEAADCPLIGGLNGEFIDIFRAELDDFPGEELYVLYTLPVPEADRRGWLGHVTPEGLVTDATLGPGPGSNCGPPP